MIPRICTLISVAGILTAVVACGGGGTDSATATAAFQIDQTSAAGFQVAGTAVIANLRATQTTYAQSSTRTASVRAGASVGSRGTSGIGSAVGSATGRGTIPGVAAQVAATPGAAPTLPPATPGASPTPTQVPTAAPTLPPATATPAVTAPSAAAPTGSAEAAYRDPAGRFSFLIPPGWSVQQTPTAGVAVAVISASPRGSANVATETVTGAQTLDEYTAATVSTIRGEHAGFRFATAGVEPATLAGLPARRYVFSDGEGEAGVRFVQYVALAGRSAYVLTLTSAAGDAPLFLTQARVLVDSFRFGTSASLTFAR